MIEEWKSIENIPGYSVSSLGRIRNDTTGTIRKFTPCPGSRYAKLHVGRSPNRKHYAVHRLVANAFLENTDNKTEVNHKNGNKYDNRVDNLEWCDHVENMKHAFENSICKYPPRRTTPVVMMNPEGEIIGIYNSVKEASEQTNTSINTIYCTLSTKNTKPVNGRIWMKLDKNKSLTTSENKVDV